MLVQRLACFFVILGVVVGNKPPEISQNKESSVRSISRSQSSSFETHSSSSSTSFSSSTGSTTPVDCHGGTCDRNSTYKKCPNPCPGTCENPNGVPNCEKMCEAYGCECNPGYFVSKNGKCVKLEDCPGKCDRNSTYKKCPNPCPGTCENPNGVPNCKKMCEAYGCECKPGYVVSKHGKCVKLEDCPGKCDRNSTFKKCPNPCPGTCENPNGVPNCEKLCEPYGCECKTGYVVSKNGKCVKLEDCPGKCDRNSTYKKCPNPCPGTCENPNGVPNCKKMCEAYGCECKPGYVVSKYGKCVKLEDCPGKCDRNSTFKKCPNPCPGTCENPNGVPNCEKLCEPYGCECKPGYVVSKNAKCVKLEDCPGKCDRNSTFKKCPNPCPGTCDNPNGIPNCEKLCEPYGCECKPGYVVSKNGKCVKLEDCPGKCDRNSTYKKCPNPCPGTCENPNGVPNCKKMCEPYGCECKPGYVVSKNGKCVKLEDCPGKCDRNSTYKKCPNPCPGTCRNPNGVPNCKKMCKAYGCECNPGYVVSENGKCVKLEDCPDYLRCNDCNATFKECPNPCPGTCAFPGRVPCNKACLKNGCECKPDYYLNEKNKCVLLQDCPGAKTCSVNETFVFCEVECPSNYCPTDDSRATVACSAPFPCGSGCSCKGDYYRSRDDDRCILFSDCPPIICTRPNEEYCARPPPCIFDKCTDIGQPNKCDWPYPNRPQCVCKPGFYRNDNDICVPQEQCSNPTCGLNEYPVECKTICPPQSCDISYTDYYCINVTTCEPGCDCLPNYLRNASGVCIPNDECPPPPTVPICEENEELSICKIVCPPQSCASIYTSYICPNNTPCEWGCDCKNGYLRDADGVCIPSEQCPTSTICDIPPECRPTCANPEPSCRQVNLPTNGLQNQDGCRCKPGYILSDTNGVCIRVEECPDTGCNGDPNAVVTACPWPCPSTCESPNAGSYGYTCDPVGCQCKPGFILEEDSGKCILSEDCECGNPCGANGTFSECGFRCPNQYCPEDDSLLQIACKPGRPCPSGCLCKPYYLRKSYNDDTCVLASDCTPVTCTRPNEVWNPCASECLAENCDDLITKPECYPDPKYCRPQCVCCKGYYRNKSGICVLQKDCPSKCEVQQDCRPTCAVPNPPDCPFIQPSEINVDSCNCQAGYVLSEVGGKCIKIDECPKDQSCNGDPHARIKECPHPCASTCESPNATPCKRKCDPIGCECEPGYLKSETGRCILPDDCKGGNPCGENGTFVACKYNFITNYCPTDDSRAIILCEIIYPFTPCFSGCACRLNHKRLSREDPRCILSSECPPVECTRQNEIWNSCPSECGSEYCEAVDSPPVVCNTLVLNCNPRCECKKNYFRNDSDICVSSNECRKLNKWKKVHGEE